ncbi:MAG: 1-acyl-sn-glycerol-3-phosphate acyltransferase [Oscillospiraceae bacterium]|nr:1-acyl-sn-glycerol-3-phosphate acyltransferase [Oscillospiraceae bacterium]
MFYAIARGLVNLIYHIVFKITIVGKENIPTQKGGCIIASNHVSNNDPPFIGIVFKGKYTFMAKEELFKNRFFGWLIRRLGAFPVKRGAKDFAAIDKAIESLAEGRTFIIFPEGTRSKDGELGRAKSGVSIIAVRANAPVIPVFVKYGRKKFRRNALISIGEVIPKEEFEAADITDKRAIHAISNKIMGKIAELKASAPDID